jgi:hypothetical protein
MADLYFRLKFKNSGLTPYSYAKEDFVYSKFIQLNLNIAPFKNDMRHF